MTTNLSLGDRFPDIELPNQDKERIKLSTLTQPSLMDQYLGFTDGYPLILVFYRGFFCPRDRQQFTQLVQFQSELAVNYGKLVGCVANTY
jgi:peroxiredoxin